VNLEALMSAAKVVYTSKGIDDISLKVYAFIIQAEVVLVPIYNLTIVLYHSGIDFIVFHLIDSSCY
jgi:hypothetical protein